MSKRLQKFASFIRSLLKVSPKTRRRMLKEHCDGEFVCCIAECAKNLLKGNVPLNEAQKKRLIPKRRMLRLLALKKTSLRKKRKLIQSGGFLGALLSPIVSILGSLFGGS